MEWPDFQEDTMSRVRKQRFCCVPSARERMAGTRSNVRLTSFTLQELDVMAPLTTTDRLLLSREQTPPSIVVEHMARRVAAAHFLKYGRHQ